MTKALFLTSRWPDQIENFSYGTSIRMRMMLEAVSSRSEQVDIVFLAEHDANVTQQQIEIVKKFLTDVWCIHNVSVFCVKQDAPVSVNQKLYAGYIKPWFSFLGLPSYKTMLQPELIAAVRKILRNNYSYIFVHRLNAAIPLLFSDVSNKKIYMDLDDVEHKAFQRSINQPPYWGAKKLLRFAVPALERGERNVVKMTEKTFVCSELDSDYLNTRWKMDRVVAINNSVSIPDIKGYYRGGGGAFTVLFVGILNYPPNAIGIERFIRNVWPKIHQCAPKAKLIVAGRYHDRVSVSNEQVPGVEFLGFVNDLSSLYMEASVVICPIYSGGGTRLKIIEACSYGKPVVSTRIGAEGLKFVNGEEIIVVDDDRQFSEKILFFLNNFEHGLALGNAARRAVISQYSKTDVVNKIASYFPRGD